ncbi:MAG: hypothetical protein ACERKZ_01410 [Lachnotalea sp.]
MPIRPIELNGVISRVQDMGSIKQNEDDKPLIDQSKFQNHFNREVDQHQKKVRDADDSDNYQKKYDAKEKGNGTFHSNQDKKKKHNVQEEKHDKKQELNHGFDISI